ASPIMFPMWFRALRAAAVVAVACVAAACHGEMRLNLGPPQQVADGVELFRVNNAPVPDNPGPLAIQILRIDPERAVLSSAIANDRVMSLETVPEMAARTGALAAINAGFFVRNGDPAGLLEVGDELVSETGLMRGAVGVVRKPGQPVRLVFDRVSAGVTLRYTMDGEAVAARIDGVNTTRVRGRLMLYTPRYGPDSDTAPAGVEWQLDGSPLRVTDVRANAGKTTIPRAGAVLSFGGTVLPTALERLTVGQDVGIETSFQASFGTLPETWIDAVDIVGGAGLLVFKGTALTDWSEEQLRDGFTTERHPRTVIGASKNGTIWLITVDGRNPQVSVGMTFAELQRLASDLKLYYALNLDGGGSTTMVVKGAIVNHPSDPAGPRRVSDGIIVTPRRQ
ncbi:MAG: phosphodiester glycosidase family protein, partial [Vicinamibacterales bacterium]|nr:phosphodiester glycosidase family protein [Vicinamibacterales bacterium]